MYIPDFLKLNPHYALFILLQALYYSHSKKKLVIYYDMVRVNLGYLTLSGLG
jgi:hypothetical protein